MPDWDAAIRSRLKTLHLDGARESETVEELAEHLDDRYRELLADGIDEARAHVLALEELDSHELITARRRRTPEAPPVGAGGGKNFMESIWHDLKVSFRMIRMKPAFSAAVVGMLALGVAGNAAIFSIFNGLFLRPMPFADPGQLVDIDETAAKWNLEYTGVAIQDFYQWQKANTTFDGMACFAQGGANMITPDGVAQRVRTAQVTYNLLDVFGLKPVVGRAFLPEEDRPNGGRVVMLGYDLWKRLFNGDTSAIGKTLKFDDNPFTIVGVLPKEAVVPDAEVWSPLQADVTQGSGWYLTGIGRLKRGVTVWQAADDLTRVHRGMIATGRQVNEITTPVVAFVRDRYFGDLKRVTRILLGAVGVVLLIACVNIAGLMLVRGESRSREIAIRTAVGASRGRVIRQLLTESLVLAAGGGILGIALGQIFLNGLLTVISDNVPKWVRFDLDWRFSLFCIAATGAAAVVFGLAPALQAASVEAAGCLQAATRSTLTRGKRGVLSVLVTGEIALALILLISSGLLVQAFRKVLRMDPGFRSDGVLTFSLRTPGTRYPKPEQRLAFFSNAIARLRTVPGVASVSAASIIPLNGHSGNFYQVENGQARDGDQAPVTLSITALPGYFQTMGMTLLAGRDFQPADNQPTALRVTVVNESFARYFWGAADVVGRRMKFNGGTEWMHVVGVIRDIRHYGLDGVMRPSVFMPYTTGPRGTLTFALRGSVDPQALVSPARDILRQIDSELPMYDVRTMSERMDRSLWMRRAYSWLFAAFAGVAIVLATAGIYGVISFAVSQRTREIGIRMALGAKPGQVMGGVLRNGMLLVAAGIAIGLGATLATARLLEKLLFGVSPSDVATYVAVIAGVVAVGLLANYVPARRASRVDPMSALRAE